MQDGSTPQYSRVHVPLTSPIFRLMIRQGKMFKISFYSKSKVGLLQTLSGLFQLVQFIKCWHIFLELNSKRLEKKKKKVVVLCSRLDYELSPIFPQGWQSEGNANARATHPTRESRDAVDLFSRGVILTRARVSLALLSLRTNGGNSQSSSRPQQNVKLGTFTLQSCSDYKETKKRNARAKLLFYRSKPVILLPFSLASPSLLLQLPIAHAFPKQGVDWEFPTTKHDRTSFRLSPRHYKGTWQSSL